MPNMVFGAHVAIPEKSAKIKTKASIMVKKKTRQKSCAQLKFWNDKISNTKKAYLDYLAHFTEFIFLIFQMFAKKF